MQVLRLVEEQNNGVQRIDKMGQRGNNGTRTEGCTTSKRGGIVRVSANVAKLKGTNERERESTRWWRIANSKYRMEALEPTDKGR